MITQFYKIGDKVMLTSSMHPWNTSLHTVITISPIYKKQQLRQRIKNIFHANKPENEIIGFKYRCKCNLGMADFLQEDLQPAPDKEIHNDRKNAVGNYIDAK